MATPRRNRRTAGKALTLQDAGPWTRIFSRRKFGCEVSVMYYLQITKLGLGLISLFLLENENLNPK